MKHNVLYIIVGLLIGIGCCSLSCSDSDGNMSVYGTHYGVTNFVVVNYTGDSLLTCVNDERSLRYICPDEASMVFSVMNRDINEPQSLRTITCLRFFDARDMMLRYQLMPAGATYWHLTADGDRSYRYEMVIGAGDLAAVSDPLTCGTAPDSTWRVLACWAP